MTRRLVSYTWPLLGVLVVLLVELHLRLPGQRITRVRGTVTHVTGVPLGGEIRRRLVMGAAVALLVLVLPGLAQWNARRWRGRPTERRRTLFDGPWHRDPVFWAATSFAGLAVLGLAQTTLVLRSAQASIGHPFTEQLVVMNSGPGAVGAALVASVLFFGSAAIMSSLRVFYRRLGDPSWQRSRKRHRFSAPPAHPPH